MGTLLARRGRTPLLALLADQSPSARSKQQVWLQYFGQDTAFFPGPGVIGARLGYLPIFLAVRRESRGRYIARLLPLVAPEEQRGARSDLSRLRQSARGRDTRESGAVLLGIQPLETVASTL